LATVAGQILIVVITIAAFIFIIVTLIT